jgi:hypothetical protein
MSAHTAPPAIPDSEFWAAEAARIGTGHAVRVARATVQHELLRDDVRRIARESRQAHDSGFPDPFITDDVLSANAGIVWRSWNALQKLKQAMGIVQ